MSSASASPSFACPHCRFQIRYKSELAGRRGSCPQCKKIIEIPRAAAVVASRAQTAAAVQSVAVPMKAPASPARGGLAAQVAPAPAVDPRVAVLNSFTSAIPAVESTPLYHVGIGLAAVAMLLLAVAYVGIVALVIYLTYYHGVHNAYILSYMDDKGKNSARGGWVFAYFAPLGAGLVLAAFLIKPLFAKRAVFDKPRSLRRQDEQFLFAFVDRICEAVNAPKPSRIDVDCQVNASASFRGGIWSIFGGDLVLTIGLPLVAGLNLQQFAGVLAHEFGHFSQGAGMRVSFLVRSISMWFTRVVYERDQWDDYLRSMTGQSNAVGVFGYLAIACIWLTRRVLWCLMMLGHMVSSFLMRQMEFDADRYEARLVGSQTFESTQRQLVVLSAATQGAYADLSEFSKEGRLGDNLPLLIQANVKQIPAEALAKIFASAAERRTGLFDTHPADAERVASAQREQAAGVFHRREPATALFVNFAALAKTCTFDFYRAIFGENFKLTDMHSVEDLLKWQSVEEVTYKSLGRYFQGTFSGLWPISLPNVWSEPPKNAKETLALVKRLRDELIPSADRVKGMSEQYRSAANLVFEADQAKALIQAKLRFKPTDYHLKAATLEAARESRDAATFKMGRLATALEKVAEHNGQRLYLALQLMHVPQVAVKLPEAKVWQAQVNDLLHVAQLVGRQVASLLGLRNAFAGLSVLLANLESNRENQPYIDAVISSMRRTWESITEIRQSLTQATYPFDHAQGEMRLETFVLPEMPHREDLGGIYNAAERVLDRVPALYVKVYARLTWMGEQIEQAVGLPNLAQPEDKPIDASSTNNC